MILDVSIDKDARYVLGWVMIVLCSINIVYMLIDMAFFTLLNGFKQGIKYLKMRKEINKEKE
jgi:hypothetical protein